jgi:hypothetical protein
MVWQPLTYVYRGNNQTHNGSTMFPACDPANHQCHSRDQEKQVYPPVPGIMLHDYALCLVKVPLTISPG